MTTPPVLLPVHSFTPRAIDISSTLRIAVYDCLYLALAEREGCEFITADDKLVKNLQGQFPFVVPLASMP
jgi:predicted nucleic acid-binding protein